jgi:hypothetical protein
MSAMIYDNSTSSYKEAETPKAWNGSAFVDTEGYYWEDEVQKEAWINNIVTFVQPIPNNATDLFRNGSFKNVSGINLNSNNGSIVGSTIRLTKNQFIDFTNNTGRRFNFWVECHSDSYRKLYLQLANGNTDVLTMISTGGGREYYNSITDNETSYPGAVFYGSQYGNTRLRYDSYTVGEHVVAYLNSITSGQRFGCGNLYADITYVDRISIL